MKSILSQLKPVTDARLDELLAKLLDGELILVGSKGETAEDVAACFYELRQLRAAAQPPRTADSIPTQGGDERAAARPVPMTAEYFTAVTGFPPQDDDLDRVNCPKAGELGHSRCGWCDQCNKPRFHCPYFQTHPAPTSLGAGHAELAPAADPSTTPLGSAVGGPGVTHACQAKTIRGLTSMTEQEVFDTVATHLIRQNRQSVVVTVEHTQSCRYRHEIDGQTLRCAIGCLIPDERYYPGLEGKHAASQPVLEAANLPDSMNLLLSRLQAIHDGHDPEDWPDRLRSLADLQALSTWALDVALAKRCAS